MSGFSIMMPKKIGGQDLEHLILCQKVRLVDQVPKYFINLISSMIPSLVNHVILIVIVVDLWRSVIAYLFTIRKKIICLLKCSRKMLILAVDWKEQFAQLMTKSIFLRHHYFFR